MDTNKHEFFGNKVLPQRRRGGNWTTTTCRDGREHGGRHKDTKNKLKAGTGNIERRTLNFEHPMRAKHGTGVYPQISRMNADFLFFIGVIRVICGKTKSFKTR
jgi:hypothetical protein